MRKGAKKRKKKKSRAEEIRVTRHETVIGTSTMLRINRRRTRRRGVSPRGGFALSRVHRTRTRFLEELVDTDEKEKKERYRRRRRSRRRRRKKKKSEYFVKRRARNAAASSYFTRRGLVRGTSHTGSYLGDLIPGNVLSSYISADLAASPSPSPSLPFSLSLSSSPLSTRFFSLGSTSTVMPSSRKDRTRRRAIGGPVPSARSGRRRRVQGEWSG